MAVQDSEFARIRNKVNISEQKLQNINSDGSAISASVGVSSSLGLFNQITSSNGILIDNLNISKIILKTNTKTVELVADESNISYVGTTTANSFAIRTNNTERFIINNSGLITTNLQLANGIGIDFSATADATGMSSELFDDYEEGTWSPFFSSTGTQPSLTYTSNGAYTKIGNIVIAAGYIYVSAVTSAGTGFITISGLPYSSISNLYSGTVSNYGALGSLPATAPAPYAYRVRAYSSGANSNKLDILYSFNSAVPVSNFSIGSEIGFIITYRT